jgi:hypothetical protein
MDWKLRLQQDTEDFFARKVPSGDYDLDIVYNAYPKRIEGKIPKEVVVFVAKTLAGKLAHNPGQYQPLFDYLWQKKGENGHLALIYIYARIARRQPELYLEQFFQEYIAKSDDATETMLMLDKVVLPLLKEDTNRYLDVMIRWMKTENLNVKRSLMNLIIKVCSTQPELARTVFKKLEITWLYATPEGVKLNSLFVKALAKIDLTFYYSVFEHYKQTRNPVFVEILSGAVVGPSPQIESALENWLQSGNARLKKAALAAQRIVQRKKG